MKEIKAIRGKLVNFNGNVNVTNLCDKGIIMQGYASPDPKVFIDGEWHDETSITPKKLVVEINYEEMPNIPKGWGSHPDARAAMKSWEKKFVSVMLAHDAGFYFMDSVHYLQVEAAQVDWIDLSEFAGVCGLEGEELVMQKGEVFQMEETKRVISSIHSHSGFVEHFLNGFYNSIPIDKRGDALKTLSEALKILQQN